MSDSTRFPEGFFDIGGKTFLWAYTNKKVFTEFIQEITEATGIFKLYQDYVFSKISSKTIK